VRIQAIRFERMKHPVATRGTYRNRGSWHFLVEPTLILPTISIQQNLPSTLGRGASVVLPVMYQRAYAFDDQPRAKTASNRSQKSSSYPRGEPTTLACGEREDDLGTRVPVMASPLRVTESRFA